MDALQANSASVESLKALIQPLSHEHAVKKDMVRQSILCK